MDSEKDAELRSLKFHGWTRREDGHKADVIMSVTSDPAARLGTKVARKTGCLLSLYPERGEKALRRPSELTTFCFLFAAEAVSYTEFRIVDVSTLLPSPLGPGAPYLIQSGLLSVDAVSTSGRSRYSSCAASRRIRYRYTAPE